MKRHFIIEFIHRGSMVACVWYNNDKDGFITENNALLHFSNTRDAQAYCAEHGMACEDEIVQYDIDQMAQWVADAGQAVDVVALLDFWNIIIDVASSLNLSFSGNLKTANRLYDKLFHGNNLPSVNASGMKYIPEWTEEELAQMRAIIKEGVNMLSQALSI